MLQPGEPVLATARAAVEASPLGLLGGIPAILALSAEQRSQAVARGFPASGQMVLAVTDRRLLVFDMPAFRQRPKLRGEVPFEVLQDAVLQRGGLNSRFRFVLRSGGEVTFTTYRLDHPEEFIQVLNRAHHARALAVPEMPEAPQIPVVPPPPPL